MYLQGVDEIDWCYLIINSSASLGICAVVTLSSSGDYVVESLYSTLFPNIARVTASAVHGHGKNKRECVTSVNKQLEVAGRRWMRNDFSLSSFHVLVPGSHLAKLQTQSKQRIWLYGLFVMGAVCYNRILQMSKRSKKQRKKFLKMHQKPCRFKSLKPKREYQ